MEDVVDNPGEYHEILSFWQRPREPYVFGSQLARWEDFRRLQKIVRGQNAYDHWRDIWESGRRHRRFAGLYNVTIGGKTWMMKIIGNVLGATGRTMHIEEIVYVSGEYRRWYEFVGHQGSKTKEGRFPEYVKALKDRLTNYGFTRIFQLNEDPARQDKLTTWIEYLGYEYWWYDQYATTKIDEKCYNAWKELVDSNVLKPSKIEEFIFDVVDSVHVQCGKEIRGATKAVRSATWEVKSAQKAIAGPQRSKSSSRDLRQRLLDAQAGLDKALKKCDSIKRREDLIIKFDKQYGYQINEYRIAKRDAERHLILLRWMLQQVPLIELEVTPPNTGKDPDGDSRRRVKHDQADKQSFKEQGGDERENHRASADSASQVVRHNGHDIIDNEQFSQPRDNSQCSGHSNSKILKSGDTELEVSTEALQYSEAVVGNKKAQLVRKGRQDVKNNNSSGLDTSLRGSKIPQPLMVTKPPRRSSRIAERKRQLRDSSGLDTPLRRSKKASLNAPQSSMTKTLRRSARIAHQLCDTIAMPSDTPNGQRSLSEKRGHRKRGGPRDTSKPQGISKGRSTRSRSRP